ncbi:hypothetical protein SAMN05216266_101617 [Amycolatopsis marina]|uniref:DUF4352 domain-containing protein n=1 Tax=Amycolatopsis marina TaxID=490629 RepID=A0A1I0VZ39_9PSEU|nr:hypothetical protein [Amycolatopsis marina]SFA81715.1 hypothetical protein SAMN05216266_101617 [Amycolatopsis marina]
MRHLNHLLACTAALVLLTGCDTGPASGTGATVVNDQSTGSGSQAANADAALGSRESPLDLGTTIEMGDWTLAVVDITRDATDVVLQENEFNEPPADGRQFVLFSVEATYAGADSGTAWTDFSWAIVGNDGNTFGGGSMNDYCGVIPTPLDETGETFAGGNVKGNVCISAASDQLDGATIRVEETLSFEDTRAFYGLQ